MRLRFACLCMMPLLACFAASCDKGGKGSSSGGTKGLPKEYAVLAKVFASDLYDNPDKANSQKDGSQILAEMQSGLLDLNRIDPQHPELGQLAVSGKASLKAAMESWSRMQRLPKSPSESEEFWRNFGYGFTFNVPAIFNRQEELQNLGQAWKNELACMGAALSEAKSVQLTLPKVALRYCGPATRKSVLAIDFNEEWGPASGGDWISLVNVSGRTLTNCTILVETKGIRGEVAQNVHFVRVWRPSQAMYAKYENGYEGWPKATCYRVQEVQASIWCDELSVENIRYVYAGREKDKDVARFCKQMQVLTSYRPFSKGIIWDDQRALNVTLQGIAYLVNPKITVTFYRGTDSVGWYWEFDAWKSGESKTLDTNGNLKWDPDRYTVTVSFQDTGYKWSAEWKVK